MSFFGLGESSSSHSEPQNNMIMTFGIVTKIGVDENNGKVKARFLYGANENFETGFIDVMSPMASKGYGMAFIPEVGDKVVLGFCEGNVGSPVVLGCLYDPKNNLFPIKINKDGDNAKNDIRQIKTKAGHIISFNDDISKDDAGVILTTKSGVKCSLLDKSEISLSIPKSKDADGNVTATKALISIKDDSLRIELDSKLEIKVGNVILTIDGGNNSSVSLDNSKGAIEIKGQSITLKGTAGVTIDAGGGSAKLSGGTVDIKGNNVTRIG